MQSGAPMTDPNKSQIASWSKNAERWTAAVRGQTIASRREATDAAILSAARAGRLGKALDVGCGEGWLCRELSREAVEIVGVDASRELISCAREAGGASYHVLSYAELAETPGMTGYDFDTIICNFSLLDDKSTRCSTRSRRSPTPKPDFSSKRFIRSHWRRPMRTDGASSALTDLAPPAGRPCLTLLERSALGSRQFRGSGR